MNEQTRKRIADQEQEKFAVPNVVTTHSDIAKVASGEDVALVPTVRVYTEQDPMKGQKLEVADPTVRGPGARPGGTPVLDRAESTLAQPKGDEYSALSATGPELPEGPAADAADSKETTKPAFDVKDSAADRAAKVQEQGDKAAKAAEAQAKKDAPKEAPKSSTPDKGK